MANIVGNTSESPPFTGWKDPKDITFVAAVMQCRSCKMRWVGQPHDDGDSKRCPYCGQKYRHHILWKQETGVCLDESVDPVEELN